MIVDASQAAGTSRGTAEPHVGLVHLTGSDLLLADATEDVRGKGVVDPAGHRVGDVTDLLVDTNERRARLMVVVSGGILGLSAREQLIPVEAVSKVDDRVHVELLPADVQDRQGLPAARAEADAASPRQPDLSAIADVYRNYGLPPFWIADRPTVALRLS